MVENKFINVELEELINFKSKYSGAIYEYLKSFSNSEGFINKNIDIETLRKLTFTENKYKANRDFKNSVLNKVFEDLEKSSLKMIMKEVREKGRGKRLTHINFQTSAQLSIFNYANDPVEEKNNKLTFEEEF